VYVPIQAINCTGVTWLVPVDGDDLKFDEITMEENAILSFTSQSTFKITARVIQGDTSNTSIQLFTNHWLASLGPTAVSVFGCTIYSSRLSYIENSKFNFGNATLYSLGSLNNSDLVFGLGGVFQTTGTVAVNSLQFLQQSFNVFVCT